MPKFDNLVLIADRKLVIPEYDILLKVRNSKNARII